MKLIKDTIKIYSSPKEAPIGRYCEFLKYLSQAIDIDTLFSCLNKAKAYSEEFKNEDCNKEIDNSITCIKSISSGISIYSYAFAVLVTEIDGKEYNDKTEEGLDLVIKELERLEITQQDIEDGIEFFKKKVHEELERLFPTLVESHNSILYYSKLKRYILVASSVYSDLESVSEDEMTELKTLKNWFVIDKDGAKSIDKQSIEIERNFIYLLPLLELTEDNSIVEFHSKIDYLNKKNERESSN